MNELKIFYSVHSGGDGSAYPVPMESEELCKIDQEFMEDWGEPCWGWFTVESDSPIKLLDKVTTAKAMLKETKEELEYETENEHLKGKVEALENLIRKGRS